MSDHFSPITAVIVLNWQGWQDTITCLESLYNNLDKQEIAIIVCDNASADDSVAHISQWAYAHYSANDISLFSRLEPDFVQFTAFTLLQTGKNLGFAGGNNIGIDYVLRHSNCQYLWILNNDTSIDKNALQALQHCAEQQPQVALIGSTLIDYYQRETVQCAGGCRYYPLLTIFSAVMSGWPLNRVLQYTKPVKLDYVCGAALFLRAAAIKEVGLLNEEYFLFYEELDYTQRLKRHGYTISWCQYSLVYHKGSASVGSVREGNRDKLRTANYYENLSTLKYSINFYPKLIIFIMLFRFVLKSLALFFTGRWFLFPPLFKAYQDFISARLGRAD